MKIPSFCLCSISSFIAAPACPSKSTPPANRDVIATTGLIASNVDKLTPRRRNFDTSDVRSYTALWPASGAGAFACEPALSLKSTQMRQHRLRRLALAALLLAAPSLHAIDLRKETADAFDKYVADLETHLDRRWHGEGFLWSDSSP